MNDNRQSPLWWVILTDIAFAAMIVGVILLINNWTQ